MPLYSSPFFSFAYYTDTFIKFLYLYNFLALIKIFLFSPPSHSQFFLSIFPKFPDFSPSSHFPLFSRTPSLSFPRFSLTPFLSFPLSLPPSHSHFSLSPSLTRALIFFVDMPVFFSLFQLHLPHSELSNTTLSLSLSLSLSGTFSRHLSLSLSLSHSLTHPLFRISHYLSLSLPLSLALPLYGSFFYLSDAQHILILS
ncbi:unnamed protein product [Acanthosepion pharaonis]|uniref:Uncharacterized protein n=1 Tax=Acanthosepion pharaonis TaxID=158019 RepID=A0A812CFS0_ACAPH|nr:unnamed protein product [Sepia pharaonis]